jgi:hypothetical protein
MKLRCVSIGSTTEFEAEKDSKKVKITYSFADILETIYTITEQLHHLVIENNNIEIKCNIPNIFCELDIIDVSQKSSLTYEDIMPYFVEHIKINNKHIVMRELPYEAQMRVLHTLPTTVIDNIQLYITNIIQQFAAVTIYNFDSTEIKFSFIGTLYTDYIKFIFRENMYKIYQEIYILSKHVNMSAEYIEKMTPLEREMYISFFKQENKTSSEGLPPQQDIPISPAQEPVSDFNIDSFDDYKNIMGG